MNTKVKNIPERYHTITPNLIVDDAAKAIMFYSEAFAATETMRMTGPDGRIMHAELQIGDSIVMVADETPEIGSRSPSAYGGTPVNFYVFVENVDTEWGRALQAGATPVVPLADMFWGDRTGLLKDPFGHNWWLAQHVKDPTPDEVRRGQEAFLARA